MLQYSNINDYHLQMLEINSMLIQRSVVGDHKLCNEIAIKQNKQEIKNILTPSKTFYDNKYYTLLSISNAT